MEFIIKERAQLDEVLEKTKDSVRILELERDNLNDKCSNMTNRIQELQTELDAVYHNNLNKSNTTSIISRSPKSSLDRMMRDKAELEEINAKLLKELGQARASVQAAQKLKISKIADV